MAKALSNKFRHRFLLDITLKWLYINLDGVSVVNLNAIFSTYFLFKLKLTKNFRFKIKWSSVLLCFFFKQIQARTISCLTRCSTYHVKAFLTRTEHTHICEMSTKQETNEHYSINKFNYWRCEIVWLWYS